MFLQLLLLLEYQERHCDSGSILDLEGRNLSSMCSLFFFLTKSQIEILFAIKGNDGWKKKKEMIEDIIYLWT